MDYRMKKIAAVVFVMLSVGGCSSTATSNDTSAAVNNDKVNPEMIAKADGDKKTCYQEKTIGSNRKSTRCSTKSEREKSSDVAREAWLRSQQGSAKTGN